MTPISTNRERVQHGTRDHDHNWGEPASPADRPSLEEAEQERDSSARSVTTTQRVA
ncbi:hypothetical protein [Natrialba sp. INN-245]|uniref:hypothetical protein n=1 Tax=Natrialba sp. INN-245 TaxID=2690967 RepID=UPI001310C568|nr:hypothetical protein [Natrialba sp. INN-245]MWV38769.1 hypothetical protein [Natrialba sp. INN-245]